MGVYQSATRPMVTRMYASYAISPLAEHAHPEVRASLIRELRERYNIPANCTPIETEDLYGKVLKFDWWQVVTD